MRPDLILTWPTNCDYPLWRAWLQSERERFARVIVVFSPHPGTRDYEEQARKWLTPLGVFCIPSCTVPGARDWRDHAVNRGLHASDAEWVLFAEPDFFARDDDALWRVIQTATAAGATVVGTQQDSRWHPCWLLVKRTLIDRTERYFGSDPVDHFYRFGQELREEGAVFSNIDSWLPDAYHHMAGLSRNHQLVDEDRFEETYKPDEFAAYYRRALSGPAELDFLWAGQAAEYLGWYAARMMRDG